MNSIYFIEEQKFNQLWIKILLFVLLAGLAVISLIVIITNKTNIVLAITPMLAAIIIFLLFYSLKLKTTIDATQITYQFFPIHFTPKKIMKSDISSISVITYDPVSNYGGWGIRYNGKNWAYTVAGNFAMNIELINGKKILLGTQQPEEVQNFLKNDWSIIFKE